MAFLWVRRAVHRSRRVRFVDTHTFFNLCRSESESMCVVVRLGYAIICDNVWARAIAFVFYIFIGIRICCVAYDVSVWVSVCKHTTWTFRRCLVDYYTYKCVKGNVFLLLFFFVVCCTMCLVSEWANKRSNQARAHPHQPTPPKNSKQHHKRTRCSSIWCVWYKRLH